MEIPALWISLKLAAVTTAGLCLLGAPLAFWLAGKRSFWASLAEAMVSLPLVLPPTVVGFYCLMALGPKSSVGMALAQATGGPFPFTFKGILLASMVFNLPFMVRPFLTAFRSIDPALLEASWTLKKGWARTFFSVALPLAAPGILNGVVMTFAHTIGEFGVVLMVGGNIPGVTRTLSMALFDQVQTLDYSGAHRTALVLLAVALVAMALVQWTERKPKGT